MGSKIEWTDITWNPITGCTPVSPACANCWAKRMACRLAGRFGYPEAPDQFNVTLHPYRLIQPMLLVKPKRIFVVSMGDLFHEDVPDSYITTVFDVATDADRHVYQFLTKRAERMARFTRSYCRDLGLDALPPHMWGLVTTEDQERADERIPWLERSSFQVRGISGEPLLGPLDIERYLTDCDDCGNQGSSALFSHRPLGDGLDLCRDACEGVEGPPLDWVIAGGESGPGARPMKPDWARSLRDQCLEANKTHFFFKQHGGVRKRPDYDLLDGAEWKQFPGEGT